MQARESEKGQRYILALDNARSQNKWDEVPELIRKVTKHAPHKTCFLDVARAEHQIITHSHKSLSAAQPPSSSSSSSGFSELIPSLLSTIEKADGTKQELFQAQVCLGWVHYTLNEPALAASRLPKDFKEELDYLTSTGDELSPWSRVCFAKGCYIKGAAQHSISGPQDALQIFNSLAPWLNSTNLGSTSNQFLYWSEKILADGALLAGDQVCTAIAEADGKNVGAALRYFRAWSSHPVIKPGTPSQDPQPESPSEAVPKTSIWRSYYDLLSVILLHDLPYTAPADGPARPQLATELRRIEAICETNLLCDMKFPTAHAGNKGVENWVEQVIRNWERLCGPDWHDEELGEGGQIALGKNVLDVLYRAATRTYHSFLILKRLFHVHSALAEFDLAFKALDSYIEIVTGAKERAEKSVPNEELENEGVFMRTLSEGVTILCCYGSGKEAEKAKEIVVILKEYIDNHITEQEEGQERRITLKSHSVSPTDISAAYRAIGIGLANWASWTMVSENRDDIRAEAIECLARSIAPELEDQFNYSSLYTLALLLAENRDLDAAIDYVKSALSSNKDLESTSASFSRERDLIPLWHLLALLLSAKQEFDIAERSCEAAFEQFPAAVTSLAHSERRPPRQQSHTQDQTKLKSALIDRLRNREKERIIETRMTQLAFVEVLEGPEAALNHSDQLLGLFGTLFQVLDLEHEAKPTLKTESLPRPKSSSGTVRSFRGSIFGRHKARAPDQRVIPSGEFKPDPPVPQNQPFNFDTAPAIQVTDENDPNAGDSPTVIKRSESRKLRKRSSTIKNSDANLDQDSGHFTGDGTSNYGSEIGEPNGRQHEQDIPSPETVRNAVSQATNQPQSAKQSLAPIAHNFKHMQLDSPAGHENQPPEQDIRLPTSYGFESPTGALTRFAHTQAQKYALCILVKVWLLIAGLYRRASSFEDAAEACDEASKHLKRIETLTASQDPSARSFRERGWANPKSSDELWADVYAERGLLLNAQSRPHDAMEHFEEALLFNVDHPKATISLSNLLLDIWDQKLPLQPPEPGVETGLSTITTPPVRKSVESRRLSRAGLADPAKPKAENPASTTEDEEPKLINRIAARERAYTLLSALTKRGTSWDNSEAWFALSRAYEAVDQTQKLKEVLWWCIELEDRRPIRHWSNIGSGAYVL
ncbi:putative filamentation protein (Rhf1) [Aspergillus undulatus]|uniref:putative filamentation protein (Rhf1) n=1 Tax=Aspergillus undulatus TaxID=1810928 RepID=UPI003CCDD193